MTMKTKQCTACGNLSSISDYTERQKLYDVVLYKLRLNKATVAETMPKDTPEKTLQILAWAIEAESELKFIRNVIAIHRDKVIDLDIINTRVETINNLLEGYVRP